MKKAALRAAVSPVIATVIIVVVAIAIGIAVAGWLSGLWSGFTDYEALRVLPTSYVDASTDTLNLHLANEGTRAAEVVVVKVDGIPFQLDTPIIVPANGTATITLPLEDEDGNTLIDAQPGDSLQVEVITEAGVYIASIPAR